MKTEEAQKKICFETMNHPAGIRFYIVEACMAWITEATIDENNKLGHCRRLESK